MDYSPAKKILEESQKILDRITKHLAQSCSDDGKFSVAKLDGHQIAAYDYTYMCTEVEASRAALKRLDEQKSAGKDVELEEILTHIFISETVDGLWAACYRRLDEYGITHETFGPIQQNRDLIAFLNAGLDCKTYERAAEIILHQRPQGASHWLDEQHAMFAETFKKFAETEIAPHAEKVHRHDLLVPQDIISKLAEMGCFGLTLPERYGGFQNDEKPDHTSIIVVTEELSRGSLTIGGSLITRPEIMCKAILKGGTEEQRKKWLPKLAAGEKMVAVAVTEPDYGSDVASLKVAATKTNGGWLINGAKMWCTFAGYADVIMVLARSNLDPKLKHRGLSLFIAEKPRFEGHEFEHVQEKGGKISGKSIPVIGYRGLHSYAVFFDNYFVPDENLIGGEAGLGQGFYLQMEGFSGGRLQTAGRAVGVMQAAFEAAVKYANERKVFGKAIGEYQLTRYKLSKMAALIHATRQFTYHVCRLMDQHKGVIEASQVKLYSSRKSEWVTREALQIHGGMGYAEEYPVSRYFVDSRVFSIFEGAEETLVLRVVARQLLERAMEE